MALSAGTVFQVQYTATSGNVNSGGFNIANANFLADGAATSATGNSAVFTSASYSFVAGDVGAWIYIKSGTNWTVGWYQIASVSAGAATLSSAIGQGIQVTNNRYGTQTVAGIATTASPTSGTWGIDYSQSDASRYTATDLTGTTTTCTSATNPFTTQMVGNLIHLNSGTGVTAGWYEIVSVSTGTATLDRSAGATYSVVTYNTGGAFSLGSADDLVFALGANAATLANRWFIKGGSSITYAIGASTTVQTTSGNPVQYTVFESFVSTRGDRPTGATRPTLAFGSQVVVFASGTIVYDLITTGIATIAAQTGGKVILVNCKVVNLSTTAGRQGLNGNGAGFIAIASEFICIRGNAINLLTNGGSVYGCYIHHSATGLTCSATTANAQILGNIFESCYTSALALTGASTAGSIIRNNTFYGSEAKLGIAVALATATSLLEVTNNIIYGFVSGVTLTTANTSNFEDYNDYFNNTTDVPASTIWQKGPHDLAVDPQFTSVPNRTGSTATTTAGDHLVQSGATFQTWGITPGVDYLYIASGTGVTAGMYPILSVDSETQITAGVTLAADATANKVWTITQGHNFNVGTNLKATGYPGVFPAGLTTGYIDIGAVQRQESGGGGSSSFTFS